MIIDTRGVELTPPAEWIKKEGIYVLKISEIKPDGFAADGSGAEKFKIIFKASSGEQHMENFILKPDMLWKIKVIEKAIKAPEVYDINDFIGRYVTATIKERTYNGKQYFDIKEYAECALNDKLPPIPMATFEAEQPPFDEDEADILF
jgi:hypothetical protein